MKVIVLFLLFIFTSNYSNAQLLISGSTEDEQGNPIRQVKIELDSQDLTYYSDSHGPFQIIASKKNAILTFTHLSYQTQQFYLANHFINKSNDSMVIKIQLIPKSKLLESVIISSEKVESVYTKQHASLLSYALLKDDILLLLKEKSRYKIRRVTKKGKVVNEAHLNFKPYSIEKDCMGNLHIIAKDSCYELLSTLNLSLTPYPSQDYDSYLSPCVASIATNYYFQSFDDYNKKVIYFMTNQQTQATKVIQEIGDQTAINVAQEYQLRIATSTAPQSIHATTETIENSRKLLQDIFWYKTNLTKPAYHPLIQIQDSVYIFDHTKKECSVYNFAGYRIRTFDFNYSDLEGWTHTLITDSDSKKIYATTIINGMVTLHQVNKLSGNIDQSFKLLEHSFPTQIKVKSGFVYYFYDNSSGFKKLYRQRLM